jgi:hypothetical protein
MKPTLPPLSLRPGMAQDCGAYFAVCRDELRFAESLNCAGLPLGGRSFSRVLLPLRGLQSPLVRAAMPVGQTGLQSRCPGCVNSYHHSAETARLSTITIAAWAKSSPAARKSGAARTANSARGSLFAGLFARFIAGAFCAAPRCCALALPPRACGFSGPAAAEPSLCAPEPPRVPPRPKAPSAHDRGAARTQA